MQEEQTPGAIMVLSTGLGPNYLFCHYLGWDPGLKFPDNRKTEKAKQGDFGSALPKMPTGIKTFLDVKDVQDGNDKIVQRRARRKMKIVKIAKLHEKWTNSNFKSVSQWACHDDHCNRC